MQRNARRRLSRAATLLALVMVLSSGHSSRVLAIEGGARASSKDALARATVAIGAVTHGFAGRSVNGCSGVLIAPDRVMTAAHCVANGTTMAAVFSYQGSERSLQPIRVTGISRRSIPFGNLPASIAESSVGKRSLDVAILQLQVPVEGRSPLPLAGDLAQLPSRLRLAGVGLSGQRWGTLRTTNLKALHVTDTGLTIAQVLGGQVCTGDSGGPVVIQGRRGPVLWGVASGVVSSDPSARCGNILVIAPASLAGATF